MILIGQTVFLILFADPVYYWAMGYCSLQEAYTCKSCISWRPYPTSFARITKGSLLNWTFEKEMLSDMSSKRIDGYHSPALYHLVNGRFVSCGTAAAGYFVCMLRGVFQ